MFDDSKRLDALEAAVKKLDGAAGTNETRIAGAEKGVKESKDYTTNFIESSMKMFSEVKARITSVEDANKDLAKTVATLEGDVKKLQQRCASLETEVKKLRK